MSDLMHPSPLWWLLGWLLGTEAGLAVIFIAGLCVAVLITATIQQHERQR